MIRVSELRHTAGAFSIRISLDLAADEYFVLLGMTGSGKTLFLETFCGLREASSGSITLDGQDITRAEPRDRTVGYVPQDGALFEHLNVRRNIGFSLELKGLADAPRNVEIEQAAALLKISHLLERRIRGLSGGERQRVALARAIVSRPRALILDEPVSALDEYTRQTVCEELKRLQRTLRIPVIHVCHSFEEAKLVADRVGVMHQGRIIRTGTPYDLVDHPEIRSVAEILRLDNMSRGQVTDETAGSTLLLEGTRICAPSHDNGTADFLIRSGQVEISAHWKHRPANVLNGHIRSISRNGAFSRLMADCPFQLTFYLSTRELDESGLREGADVEVGFERSAVHFLTDESGPQ